MKYNIIHTQFLDDICDLLQFTAFNVGLQNLVVSAEWLYDNLEEAFKLIQKDIDRLTYDLCQLDEDDNDFYTEIMDEIGCDDQLLVDLGILQELKTVAYAHPDHIASSIKILATTLSEQLAVKCVRNEYYCKSLARCLKELCTIIL